VTVVFADVTGSTALGERLDPESLRGIMSRYFDEMHAAVESHGGTVEKFIGDASRSSRTRRLDTRVPEGSRTHHRTSDRARSPCRTQRSARRLSSQGRVAQELGYFRAR
jgi:class 3 adenylate cyclase